MSIYTGITKDENTALCHSGESQNPDPSSSPPLDSSLRWNDSFTFGIYFRRNDSTGIFVLRGAPMQSGHEGLFLERSA
jgi:hypothetical protein